MNEEKLSRRDFLHMGAMTAAGAALASCVPVTPEVVKETEEVTAEAPRRPVELMYISGTMAETPEEREAIVTILRGFEEQYPDITVKGVAVPYSELSDKKIHMIQAGDTPEVMEAFDPRYIGMDAVVNLDELVSEWEGLDDLHPHLKNTLPYRGEWYALPFMLELRIWVYRKDFFEEAGITKKPDTWDEWLEAAKKLNKPDEERWACTIYGTPWDMELLQCFMVTHTKPGEYCLVDDPSNPTEVICDRPNIVKAAQRYVDFYRKYHLSPPETPDLTDEKGVKLMCQGRVAMYGANPPIKHHVLEYNPDLWPDKVGVLIHPKDAEYGEHGGGGGGLNNCVGNVEGKTEASWKLVKYFAENNLPFNKASRQLPPLMTDLREAEYTEEDDVIREIKRGLLEYGDNMFYGVGDDFAASKIWDFITKDTGMKRAIVGEGPSVEEILEQAAEKGTKWLQETP